MAVLLSPGMVRSTIFDSSVVFWLRIGLILP
jgi:hypothetical protein